MKYEELKLIACTLNAIFDFEINLECKFSKLELVVGSSQPIRERDYIIWQFDYNDGIFKIWSHILGIVHWVDLL
jgi:hypothetical protein